LNSHFSNIYLVEGSPYYVGDLIDLQNEESNQWNKLYDIIVGSNHILNEQSDVNYYDKIFAKAMNNLGRLGEAEALKDSVNLSDCKKMIDVGGGSGLYSVVFCRNYPNLKSTILDRVEVLAITKEMIGYSKESTQITLRPADITTDDFGKNIDVVLVSDIMYDELIAEPILKSAWNCLRKNGILIVRGYYSDPENSKSLFGALFFLNLLVFNPNRTILTISSLRKNVIERGFTIIKTSPLTERSIVLIAKK